MLDTGQAILTDPVEDGGCETCELRLALGRHGMTTRVVVPLQTAEETAGLLQLGFSRPDGLPEEPSRPLLAIAEMGGNALQRARVMETLEQSVRDRTRDLEALYDITAIATQYLDLRMILERMLEKALGAIHADASLIHLLDEGGQALHLAAQRGLPAGLIDQVQPQLLNGSLWGQVIERNETVTAQDVALLTAIADHTGVAVESAQLRRQAEEAAVLEERQRLAHELHDSVTQSLYSLTLFAEAGQDSARAADLAEVEHHLKRVDETTQQALKEMRLLIYELHPPALTQAGLVGALRQRLEAVERRAQVKPQPF